MKKSDPMWKVIFITLLIINFVYVVYLVSTIAYAGSFGGYVLLSSFPFLLVLSIIDLLVIVSYIREHHSHSTHGIDKKIIIDAALIAAGFILIFSGVIVYMAANLL
jgi:hypothetical protein